MLQIFHNSIDNQIDPQEFYQVEAIIDDLSEAGLIEDELKVFWWTDGMNESEELVMEVCPQDIPDCYNAQIPSQFSDSEVKYYIQAIDLTGRFETLPMAGYFSFDAIGGTPAQDGDVNLDGSINVLDIVVTVNHVLGIGPISGYEFQIADMNDDGIVNILDIISIVNLIIGS